jgi:hypothetical protein
MTVKDVSPQTRNNLEHGPNLTHQACLCKHRRQDRYQQKNREEFPSHRLGRHHQRLREEKPLNSINYTIF